MAEKVELKIVSGGKTPKRSNCASPIITKRINPETIEIGFSKDNFDIEMLEFSLRGLAHGETAVWRLYRLEAEDPFYAHYLIRLDDSVSDKDDILKAVVYRISKEAYSEETRSWNSEVNLSDLTKPFRFTGKTIDAHTKSLLENSGLRDIKSISHSTREELCQIPGMTTEMVASVEKSLATRGIFLRTMIPSN